MKLLTIQDMACYGKCSGSIAMPVLSAMGIETTLLPTSVLSTHSAFKGFTFRDLLPEMEAILDHWISLDLQFDAIYIGYLGSEPQLEFVHCLISHFPNAMIMLDPVMGDNGKLYSSYSPVLAEKMVSLVPFADILTPNLTEACILTKTEYNPNITKAELEKICTSLSEMGPEKIIISGLERQGDLENFIFEKGKLPVIIREHKVGSCRSGTGDVFSSIITADMVNGKSLTDSVRHASAFIAKVLRRALELQLPLTDGICFEEFLTEI